MQILKKKFRFKGSVLLTGCLVLGFSSLCVGEVEAAPVGDDYPSYWKSYPVGSLVADTYGMYVRQCTSFVAHRLDKINGFMLPRGYGNANTWGNTARSQGFVVDNKPAVGSVAWWSSMHVAWVAEVSGDRVLIEEYNYGYTGNYKSRWISKHDVSGFIHFKDLTNAIGPTNPSPSPDNSHKLAPSGLYRFKTSSHVRAEPRLSSPSLASYYPGDTVIYDQLTQADGYLWISYIAGSGKRRYIAVEQVDSQSQVPANSHPVQGLNYVSHISNVGWKDWVSDGGFSGTDDFRNMEALALRVENFGLSDSIEYRAHVANVGWQGFVKDGQMAGTTGQSKAMEAVEIRLTGDLAKNYHVMYRSFLKDSGWQEWTSNGGLSGTVGQSRPIYNFQARLIKK
ncbi:SH3 domain-containing protein [Streptococcaceae bacterium ESL0729]|nr:SH3 domain-containing protein [Streptococcaceae bacterium ESL0729]